MRSAIGVATVCFTLFVVFTWAMTVAQETRRPAANQAEESSDALSARIDELVKEKCSNAWIGHNYSDVQVRQICDELAHVSFPAKDGTVAQTLKIADPKFFVAIRGCGISLLDDGVSGTTRTHEICRLNGDFELVVIRVTEFFRDQRKPEPTEVSAEIRRSKSK